MAASIDRIYRNFLHRQAVEAADLQAQSDLLQLSPLGAPGKPADRYLAEYRCKGMVKNAGGAVREHCGFVVGIWLPPDYLRRAEPAQILTWLEPINVYHPNILPPVICAGRLYPGMRLVDLIYQVFEIITYHKVTPREDDALNPDACAWARAHLDEFPLDRTPLKRRRLQLEIEPARAREHRTGS